MSRKTETENATENVFQANRRTVVKSALKVLRVEAIQTDPSYQREVKRGHTKIVNDFSEEAFGIPLVGEREDGTFWVVDGLQRLTALRKLGKKEVRAEVFASQGPEHEATVFKKVNMDRTRLSSREEFRALLTSQDPLAWKIKEAVESVGFKIVLGKTGQRGNELAAKQLTCVSTLLAVAAKYGTDPIVFACRCSADAWPGDRLGSHNSIVAGLCCFFRRHEGVVDMDRLLPRLRTVTPQKIMYAASQATLSNNMQETVADQIEKVYRKRRA